MTTLTDDPTGLPGPGERLFAYGTLKRGGTYHHLLEEMNAVFIGQGQLEIPYPLVLAAYPCLLDRPGRGAVVSGEVFRIPGPEGWTVLDRLEGHPLEYRRRIEGVAVEGQSLTAWTYFYQLAEMLDPALADCESGRTGSPSSQA